jgi:hypothetical protein
MAGYQRRAPLNSKVTSGVLEEEAPSSSTIRGKAYPCVSHTNLDEYKIGTASTFRTCFACFVCSP